MTDRVIRSLRRAWRNITIGGAWTRRVRWYESTRTDEGVSIRLNFNERENQQSPRSTWIEVNSFYDSEAEAEADMFRFVQGERALMFRNEAE